MGVAAVDSAAARSDSSTIVARCESNILGTGGKGIADAAVTRCQGPEGCRPSESDIMNGESAPPTDRGVRRILISDVSQG